MPSMPVSIRVRVWWHRTGVTVPGGHGAGLFAQVANSPAEAAEQVRDLYARGADVIKLFVTGGVFDATEVGEPGVLRMPVEVAAAGMQGGARGWPSGHGPCREHRGVRAALQPRRYDRSTALL